MGRTRVERLAGVGLLLSMASCGPPPDARPAAASDPDGVGACGDPSTPIPAVQGPGEATPMEGRSVTVEGIVVGDYEGPEPALRGFFLQDVEGDGDPETSDAVFVFNGDRDQVGLGDRVRLRGTAEEFQGQTQLSSAGSVEICVRAGSLEGRAGMVEPVEVTLPFPHADAPERLEGMLVRFPQTLYVTDNSRLARFGELSLSSGSRLPQPTQVAEPGARARAVQEYNDRNRIRVDDATNDQNRDPIGFGRSGEPLSASNTLRAGDRVTDLVGVMTWTWAGNPASGNAWRVRPLGALGAGPPLIVAGNRRPPPPLVGGSIRVASFNLRNYFDSFTSCAEGVGGPRVECRGADGPEEFERQWRKTVAALMGLNADILGVLELENDGYGPVSAIADLVERLNRAGRPARWSFVDVDAEVGRRNALGLDGIKVGLLYRSDRVTAVGATAVLATDRFVTGGDSAPRNRPSLAQAFEAPGGGRLVVNVNHLKSKGSPCDRPDVGDGQGNCGDVRAAAVAELVAWLATDPTGTGDPDVIVLGDLNAYALEDPVRLLVERGFLDLAADRLGPETYSYGFDGQWGTLDYALASPSLAAQVVDVAVWHVNADEPPVLGYDTDFESPGQQTLLYAPDPFRSSDHDPVVVGVELRRDP